MKLNLKRNSKKKKRQKKEDLCLKEEEMQCLLKGIQLRNMWRSIAIRWYQQKDEALHEFVQNVKDFFLKKE